MQDPAGPVSTVHRGGVMPLLIGGQDMPVLRAFSRRGAGALLSLFAPRRVVRAHPPRLFLLNNAGSRRAYRGRSARRYAQSARDTPRQHSLGGRGRCPVCAPGAGTLQPPNWFLDTPERRGRGGRNPATMAPRLAICPAPNQVGTTCPRATRPGETGSTCGRSERRCTPAGVERGGKAEASDA